MKNTLRWGKNLLRLRFWSFDFLHLLLGAGFSVGSTPNFAPLASFVSFTHDILF